MGLLSCLTIRSSVHKYREVAYVYLVIQQIRIFIWGNKLDFFPQHIYEINLKLLRNLSKNVT